MAKDKIGAGGLQPTEIMPTVAIGASAGGLKALQTFFEKVPADLGAAYVVIVHLDPDHQSELAKILGAHTKMPVSQVEGRQQLEPNKVYVIPPNRRLLATDHEIATHEFDEPRGQRAPINQFFRTLADQHGDGFAIILSGAGADGSIGLKSIKEGGGIILVQDPNEAEYASMPRNAISTGNADFVLPVAEIAEQLGQLIRAKKHLAREELIEASEDTFRRIISFLRSKTGHDFSLYKRSTVLRRLARRMQVCRVEKLDDYLGVLRGHPEEAQNLFADLLISVTMFFRDPPVFEALANDVIPRIFENASADVPLRIWVPGCATGEEAYTIGILLMEHAATLDERPPLQIFATDLDAGALATAREGRYPASIISDVSEERLRRFFTKEGEYYRVKRELRDIVLFANHSLLKDPPFSRLDLISCRNLLIYLDRELQQQVCVTFSYALRPGGYLLLGTSETAEQPVGLFRTVNRDARIFQSVAASGDHARHLPRVTLSPRLLDVPSATTPAPAPPASRQQSHVKALEQLGPPSILVDRSMHILHISETAGRFLQPSGGQISMDVTEMARAELRFDLRACLHKAFDMGSSELSLPIPVQFNGTPVRVNMLVRPVTSGTQEPQQAIVFFIEGGSVTDIAPLPESMQDTSAVQRIRSRQEELELTRSRLRSAHEDFEAANEELRAANEELQSINEEYRSTAEELETSKEELQSINEELQTVNAELKLKLEGVSRVNSDLQNLMSATDVGTLFLDARLCIKRFTPPIADLFNITATDEGRSITDFTHQLDYPGFAADARRVLDDLIPVEREVAGNGHWYLTRFRPYRTVDDRIDGVVVTFVDVTGRRKAEDAVRTSAERLQLLMQELSHRVKNTLAVVQSMARMSFREDVPREQALEIFSGRLNSLSHAHDMLINNDWQGADFEKLISVQMPEKISGSRITIQGPRVILPPNLATPFALVLHELMTNALKYGALATDKGTIAVTWQLTGDRQQTLEFSWQETGSAALPKPQRQGFGTKLIEQGLPGAEVKRSFDAKGMTCEIKVDIRH